MQKLNTTFLPLAILFVVYFHNCVASVSFAANEQETEYRRVIEARASKIVATLGLADSSQMDRVQQLIADQYSDLRSVHDPYHARVVEVKQNSSLSAEAASEATLQLNQQRELAQFKLHRSFLASLSAELTSDQVTQVKDGLTYHVVPSTYAVYLQLLPDLTEEEKKVVMACLVEAREYAMDAGSSDEKHGWFRKYKGRINNYLSAAGHDVKAAQERLAKK